MSDYCESETGIDPAGDILYNIEEISEMNRSER